jgi:3-hydroxyisobutyrate dehydrogenase
MEKITSVGVIGFGIMGASMAKNLARQGFTVYGYSRSKAKVEACAEAGIVPVASPAELGSKVQAVLLAVTDGAAVADVLLGENSVATTLKQGALIIDTSTIAASEALEIGRECSKRSLRFIDAPVTGGDAGARNATLTIMVGGTKEDLHDAQPILSSIGSKIIHVGPLGSGQRTKSVNQIAVGIAIVAMTEAMTFAQAQDLNLQTTLDILQGGAAGSWALSNYAPRILRGDLAPGFAASHMLKDLRIASDRAGAGKELRVLELTIKLF